MAEHVNLPFTGASGRLVSGRGSITVINFAETSGAAAAKLQLFDGQDANGVSLPYISLVASGTRLDGFARGQLTFSRGLYVNVISGTVSGMVAVELLPTDAEWAALEAVLAV